MTFIEQNGDDRAISMRLLEPSFRKVHLCPSQRGWTGVRLS